MGGLSPYLLSLIDSAGFMIGTKLAHYEITNHLGTGGMGEVYQATDGRLGRSVAIKLLPAVFMNDHDGAARFDREARVLASLNHPNIAVIHGIDESAGRKFLIMELVGGETLAERIQRGPVAIDEAFRIARQIAEGLEAAHQKGIVHRDLKPANIKITTQGQVKLLDFGLAKALAGDATAFDPSNSPTINRAETNAGMVLGTAAYMSPEQAQGRPVDERSDIFSFGAVLYELLSGRRPFTGASTIEVLSAVMRDDPTPMSAPEPVMAIVRRCLAKRATERFASVAELKAALYRIATKPAVQEKASIAVLPFANMSGDKEQEYFSDGLAEEVINLLAQIPDLKVIARTSAFAFKGQNTDIRRIAEALGVSSILEGSVRKAGSRIRVTAQLIAANDGSHLWSQRFDREMDDVFAVQDEIAQAIAEALQVKLAVRATKHKPSLPAYEAYLRYRYYQWGFTPESLQRARECLDQALALDPQFALPYVGLADIHIASAAVGGMTAREAIPRARTLAQRALELDPDLPEGHAMLGIVAGHYDLDWKEAERRFHLAMAREPISCHLRQWYSNFFLHSTGRAAEARGQMVRVLEEDPLSQIWHCMLTGVLSSLGLYDEALATIQKAVELDPQFWWGWMTLGLLHGTIGQHSESLRCAEKAYAGAAWSPYSIGLLAGNLMDAGKTEESEALLAKLRADSDGVAIGLTCFHLVRGEIDSAVEWLGRAFDQRFFACITIIGRPYEPLLRKSSGWPLLLRKMNLS
jgi:serine/threonine protein kinase/Tfp pilus assembly protein PilF